MKWKNRLLTNFFLRNAIADIWGRSEYSGTRGNFTPYFQYRIGTLQKDEYLYFDNHIQRIWYYGIVEFTEQVELALAGEYTALYSSGKMYYKETTVALSLHPRKTIPIGIFIWDLNAVIGDAENRNAAFLNLIKSRFAEK